MNEYLEKKLKVLNMHDEEPEICLMVTDQRKINVQFKSIEDETRKVYMNKKTNFIYLVHINQDYSRLNSSRVRSNNLKLFVCTKSFNLLKKVSDIIQCKLFQLNGQRE